MPEESGKPGFRIANNVKSCAEIAVGYLVLVALGRTWQSWTIMREFLDSRFFPESHPSLAVLFGSHEPPCLGCASSSLDRVPEHAADEALGRWSSPLVHPPKKTGYFCPHLAENLVNEANGQVGDRVKTYKKGEESSFEAAPSGGWRWQMGKRGIVRGGRSQAKDEERAPFPLGVLKVF